MQVQSCCSIASVFGGMNSNDRAGALWPAPRTGSGPKRGPASQRSNVGAPVGAPADDDAPEPAKTLSARTSGIGLPSLEFPTGASAKPPGVNPVTLHTDQRVLETFTKALPIPCFKSA